MKFIPAVRCRHRQRVLLWRWPGGTCVARLASGTSIADAEGSAAFPPLDTW